MKTAVAGANAVNAVSSSVSPAMRTDTLLVGVISSAGGTTKNEAEVLVSERLV
jgi:hypothetical protein